MIYAVDGNNNQITVTLASCTFEGLPMVICRMVDDPSVGYLALCEDGGGFGDEACPSSYGRPCLSWFGPGERYPDADAAIAAFA